MRRIGLGTLQNVTRSRKTEPYGKTPLGDRVFWARLLTGKTQEELGDEVGIDRVVIIKLENGSSKGNSHGTMRALDAAFGQAPGLFDAYIAGEYGPPTKEAAARFLAGESPPSKAPPVKLPAAVAQALGELSLDLSAARFGAIRDIARTLVFTDPETVTVEGAKKLLLDEEAKPRKVAAPRSDEFVEAVVGPEALLVQPKSKSKKTMGSTRKN